MPNHFPDAGRSTVLLVNRHGSSLCESAHRGGRLSGVLLGGRKRAVHDVEVALRERRAGENQFGLVLGQLEALHQDLLEGEVAAAGVRVPGVVRTAAVELADGVQVGRGRDDNVAGSTGVDGEVQRAVEPVEDLHRADEHAGTGPGLGVVELGQLYGLPRDAGEDGEVARESQEHGAQCADAVGGPVRSPLLTGEQVGAVGQHDDGVQAGHRGDGRFERVLDDRGLRLEDGLAVEQATQGEHEMPLGSNGWLLAGSRERSCKSSVTSFLTTSRDS